MVIEEVFYIFKEYDFLICHKDVLHQAISDGMTCALESCAGQLTYVGCGYPHLQGGCKHPHRYVCRCGWAGCGLNLVGGELYEQVQDEKFFVRVTEC